MEKAKPSKKKAYYKNLKHNAQQSSGKEGSDWRHVKANKSSHYDPNDPDDETTFVKRSLHQPESRLADLDKIWQETSVGQDFETLVDAPLSADGHFVFKSEKNWTLDASKYDDFFSVNVKDLATIIECIPYNRYVQVDDKYFTSDELTDINNSAEKGKKAYDHMLETLRKKNIDITSDETSLPDGTRINNSGSENVLPADKLTKESRNDSTNIEEDLDFLLSLKEPVRNHPVSVAPLPKSAPEESKTKNVPAATKSMDLEKWLDLVLED